MITVTNKAAKRMQHLLDISSVKIETRGFRFGIRSGGCSGFSYTPLSIMAEPNENDTIFESNNMRIFVDPKSLPIVDGTEIDLSDNFLEGFIFKNPNAKIACGCGISFAIKDEDNSSKK